jgi:hypothetical protein
MEEENRTNNTEHDSDVPFFGRDKNWSDKDKDDQEKNEGWD